MFIQISVSSSNLHDQVLNSRPEISWNILQRFLNSVLLGMWDLELCLFYVFWWFSPHEGALSALPRGNSVKLVLSCALLIWQVLGYLIKSIGVEGLLVHKVRRLHHELSERVLVEGLEPIWASGLLRSTGRACRRVVERKIVALYTLLMSQVGILVLQDLSCVLNLRVVLESLEPWHRPPLHFHVERALLRHSLALETLLMGLAHLSFRDKLLNRLVGLQFLLLTQILRHHLSGLVP